MMALAFGLFADAVDELEGLPEIGEGEFAGDVVVLDYLPLGNLFVDRGDGAGFEGLNTTFAGDAGFIG